MRFGFKVLLCALLTWSQIVVAQAADNSEITSQYQDILQQTPQSKELLTPDEARRLYRLVLLHPVTRLGCLSHYDPSGAIGFCFGRSEVARLLARTKFQLNEDSIRKLFIVGDLRQHVSKPEWRFHVTTLVKTTKGWIAIDPIVAGISPSLEPITASAWIQLVQNVWDRWHGQATPQAKLYLTDASAMLPNITSMPSPERGDLLIELSFRPENFGIKASMAAQKELNTRAAIYALSADQQNSYFLSTKPGAAHSFDFIGLKVNEMNFDYKNYFADLIAGLHKQITPNYLRCEFVF